MNIFKALWARIRSPRPTSIESPIIAAATLPVPTVPLAPPTEAERLAREPQRQQWVEQLLLAEEARAKDDLPAGLRRLIIQLGFIKADQDTARANDWGTELLRLQMEEQELLATIKFEGWQHALCVDHGEEIGRKLAKHQVEVGMTMEHMVASFGVPATNGITPHPTDLAVVYVSYGSLSAGSHFELRDNVITQVQLGTGSFPPYVYNDSNLMED